MKQLAVVVLLAIIGIAGLTMVNRQAQIAYAATAQGTVQKSATQKVHHESKSPVDKSDKLDIRGADPSEQKETEAKGTEADGPGGHQSGYQRS